MCYFISVAIPEHVVAAFVASVPRGLRAVSCRNPSLSEYISSHFQQFVLTSGDCSCDLFSPNIGASDSEAATERRRRKYAKLNWSATKIERALASSASTHRASFQYPGYDERVRKLIAAFSEEYGEVLILVHFYSGDVDSERFMIRQRLELTPVAFREAQNPTDEDQLVAVNPHPAK